MGLTWSSVPARSPSISSSEGEQSISEVPRNMAYSVENQSVQPKRMRKPKVTILNEVLAEKIKLNDNLKLENNAILKNFLDSFILEMKRQDCTFAKLYNRIFFTGSYYSDLRISKPDEYDLNIVLKLPFRKQDISIEYQPQVPSYVKYRLNNQNLIQGEHAKLAKFFKDNYLIPDSVRKWMQGVVDKALRTYRSQLPRGCIDIRPSAAGPARTINLIKRNGRIDIDLVPVIEWSSDTKPPGIHGIVYEKVRNNLQGFMVPKPYQTNRQAPINDKERERLWRAHYPVAESTLIDGYECIKPVIKLLKLLRDTENWKILASYYLKTIVMWMVLENPSKEYWKNDKLGDRFMEALETLADCLKRRKICYFFSSKCNLIDKISEAQAQNILGRLNTIIREINKDDWNLWKFFRCNPTFTM